MDIEKHINIALHILIFSKWSQKEKIIHHEIPGKTWEVFGMDIFTLHNKNYLCIVDYHSKFHVIKQTEYLSTDSLILTCKNHFFSEYG